MHAKASNSIDTLHSTPPFHTQASERILFLRATVNMFRLLRLLAPHAPVNPLPVGKELTRPFGTTVTIKSASVVKRIKAFSLQPNLTSSFDDLCQVRCPHLGCRASHWQGPPAVLRPGGLMGRGEEGGRGRLGRKGVEQKGQERLQGDLVVLSIAWNDALKVRYSVTDTG